MTQTLKQKVVSGLKWNTLLDFGGQVFQIVFTAILARLLSKGDFGIVAMALIVNRFFQTVTNLGFGGAIIRSKEITNGQITAVFYIQSLINLTLSIIIFFGAELVAEFFNEERLVLIIQVTCWMIFINTFQFPNVLMQRNMEFKQLAIFQIGAMLISNIVAIIMAFLGYGIWALVARLLFQVAISSFLIWFIIGWKPTKPEFNRIKPLMIFGLNMFGSNVLNYFAENLIAILTGKYLGKETLGLFNIAYNLAIVPAQKIKTIFTSVLTPGLAKIQDNVKSFAANNKKALTYTSLFFIPLMFAVSGMSENIILFIYGDKWIEAGHMLMILALVGMLKGMSHLIRSTILAKGQANIVFYSTITEVATSLPLMYFLLEDLGVYGLLIAFVVGNITSTFFTVYFYDKLFGSDKFFTQVISQPSILGVLLFLVLYLIHNYIPSNLILNLIIQIIVALSLLWVFIKTFHQNMFIEINKRMSAIMLIRK